MERGRGGAGDDSVSSNCTGCSLCSVLVMSLGLSPTPTSATALRLCAYKRASLRVDRWQLSGCTCWGLGGGGESQGPRTCRTGNQIAQGRVRRPCSSAPRNVSGLG